MQPAAWWAREDLNLGPLPLPLPRQKRTISSEPRQTRKIPRMRSGPRFEPLRTLVFDHGECVYKVICGGKGPHPERLVLRVSGAE